MTDQVDFYLLRQPHSGAKLQYACRLVNKAYQQGMTVYLQTATTQHSRELDQLLWTFAQESFVPHAVRHGETDWARFPVQIGERDCDTPAIALLLSLTDDVPPNYQDYRRVADLVANDPQEKARGRVRFRQYRQGGIKPRAHHL